MITIITTSLNNRDQLLATINDVVRFVDSGVEHIVVDGSSTDGTVEMLQSLALQHPALRWVSEPDAGIYDAMNKGWTLARSDSQILFLGAGDKLLSLPGRQEESRGEAVIYGDVENGSRFFKAAANSRLKMANTLHHQALLIPKSLHPAAPFDLRFKYYADFDFNQRLYKRNVRFLYSKNLRSYAEPGGVSARKDRFELFSVILKNFGLACALSAALTTPFRRSCWLRK